MNNRAATARHPLRAWRWVLAIACIGFAVTAAGFIWFVMRVQDLATETDRSADGVVVLTGGPERIADAIDLLAAGRGKRLLITGVNPATRMEELLRLMPRYGTMFTCCIDIDRSATNTVGNAVETKRWVRQRSIRTLIVVTSNYHMPRAMAELSHQLPDVALIPYPVVIDRARNDRWWSHAITTRTLAIEYVKYVAALMRMRIAPDPDPGTAAIAAANAAV